MLSENVNYIEKYYCIIYNSLIHETHMACASYVHMMGRIYELSRSLMQI